VSKPKPYDMEKPEEFQRLMSEVLGYMKTSRMDGTDKQGREYAINALSWIVTNSKNPYSKRRRYGD